MERLAAYGGFAAALTEFRRAQLDWANMRFAGAGSSAVNAAQAESYRRRGVAQTALSQVQLVSSDQIILDAAGEAFEATRPVHYADDLRELTTRSDAAKAALDALVRLAAGEVQAERLRRTAGA